MRYCEKCGCVIDEFNPYRDEQNCPICSGVWSEDNMTAIKYAELSESEKDFYDAHLLNLIKNSSKFNESMHQNCSTEDGMWWWGFRVDKYLQFDYKERNAEKEFNRRKANEPFKPFPPIDNVKAREVALDAEITHKKIESGYYTSKSTQHDNAPKCPTCSSTDISRVSATAKVVDTAIFGIFGQKRKHQFRCNNCKYEW